MTELTDDDRELIAKAREAGAVLRSSNGDRDRLAGWLMAELIVLAERLADGSSRDPGAAVNKRSPHHQMLDLRDPELVYIARWAAITYPKVGAEALEALAAYKLDQPERAVLTGLIEEES